MFPRRGSLEAWQRPASATSPSLSFPACKMGMVPEPSPAQGRAPAASRVPRPTVSGGSGLGLVRRTSWIGRPPAASCTGACAACCWRTRSSRRCCRPAASSATCTSSPCCAAGSWRRRGPSRWAWGGDRWAGGCGGAPRPAGCPALTQPLPPPQAYLWDDNRTAVRWLEQHWQAGEGPRPTVRENIAYLKRDSVLKTIRG